MNALLRYFYAFMLWSTELELALARHGGNMDLVNHLTERLNYWSVEAQRFEWRMQ